MARRGSNRPATPGNERDGAEMLGDVVVQFEGHASALGFLRVDHAFVKARSSPRSAGLGQVGYNHSEDRAGGNIAWQRADRDLHGQLRTVAGFEHHCIFEPDWSALQSDRRFPVFDGEKTPKEMQSPVPQAGL